MCCVKFLLILLGTSLVGSQALKIVVTNSSGPVAIDSYELVRNPCQDVRLAGFICMDCSTLGYCSNVNGQWQTVELTECQSDRGFYCNDEVTIGCTWQPRCNVPVRGKFYCQAPGIFPDPYDCRSYHECNDLNVDVPRQCTNGAAYSLLTQSCSIPRDSAQCNEKQYECKYAGQTGAWAANNTYYYVCQSETQGDQQVLYPLMMQCRDGSIFNGHSCVQSSKMLRSTQQQQEQSHGSAPCENGKIYPSDKPHGYYSCNNGQLHFQSCPTGYEFAANVNACIKTPKVCQEGMLYPAETQYGFYFCISDTLIYQNCPAGTYFNVMRNLCLQEPDACVNGVLYAADTDQGFYLCINGAKVYYECPLNYRYNLDKKHCEPRTM